MDKTTDNNNPPKIVFITGTPGVGKSTLANILEKELPATVVRVNELAQEKGLFLGKDENKGYDIVDLEALCTEINNIKKQNHGNLIIEGHLSHFCPDADVVISLRVRPPILEKRLEKRRYSSSKIRENLEAEALGICSAEAYEIHNQRAQEIDVSNLTPEKVVEEIIKIINGEKVFPIGNVDFLDWLINRDNKW